ncbi:MAG: D-mannonate epimerase, partial [Terracidiphilus sp.]
MSLYCAVGAVDTDLSAQQLNDLLAEALAKLGARNRVLAVPPDITRLHSQAGVLTQAAASYYGARLKAVLPAIGTHAPM